MKLLFEDVMIMNNTKLLKNSLRTSSFCSSKVPVFIFICGKQILGCEGEVGENLSHESNKRGLIIDGLEKIEARRPIFSIVAEQLLSVELAESDSLTFEGLLADMSDEIILIVESEGTICELGAFSFSNEINKKVFVLNNQKYKNEDSFINRGPLKKLKKINSDNVNYVDFDADWKEIPVLKKHYKYITDFKRKYNVGNLEKEVYHVCVKDLVIELLAIIEIYQPITVETIQKIYIFFKGNYRIKSNVKIKSIKQVIELLCKIGILQEDSEGVRKQYNSFACASCVFELDEGKINKIRTEILCRVIRKTRKLR